MNNRVKRLMRDLEGIGFKRDDEASSARKGTHVYRHANQPDQFVKVQVAMSDSGVTAVWRKAQRIADTGWSGPKEPATVAETARIKKAEAKREREAEDRARAERAAKAEAEYEERQRVIAATRHRSEIEDLMQPGHGH